MKSDSQNAMVNAHTLRMVDYNENSEVQALAASILSELIKKFSAKILAHLAPNETLNVCEYGWTY